MLDDDDRALMRAVNRYLKDVHRAVGADDSLERTPLAEVFSDHLGVDAASVPVTTESLSPHRYVDADIALDELTARGEGRVIGVTGGEQRFHSSASDLITNAYVRFAPGPVSYESRDISASAQRRVVAFGARLLTFEGQPLVIVQRASNPTAMPPRAQLELLGADPDATAAALAEIRRLMIEHSVLRGQVLTFTPTEYGNESGATFLERPDVSADEIVLREGALQRIVDHVVGIGDHRDALRAAGQHLKRGVLLYGPPGTGKTLTVRHLLSRTPGTTAIVLTGSSIRLVTAAAELARTFAPAMVVLEDIDLVASDREFSPQPVLFDVLDALDGLEPDADIAFVMTTNHVQILEEALAARPGRVDLGVEIPLPAGTDRRRLFRRYGEGLPLSPEALDAAADRAEGTTGSFAKELVRRTVLAAALRGESAPTDADLADALDELLSSGAALTRLLLGASDRSTGIAGHPHHRMHASVIMDGTPYSDQSGFATPPYEVVDGGSAPIAMGNGSSEDDEPWEDSTPPTHELPIPMPVWHAIYGTLDNVAAVERVGGDRVVAARAGRIMDAGSVAAQRHPGPRTPHGWPFDDEELTVPLADGDEEFLVEVLARHQRVARQILADPDLDDVVRREQEQSFVGGRDALHLFAAHLIRK